MPDDVDELILKMQHLEAHSRAQREAEVLARRGKSLKSRAQQIAWAAQVELSAAEAQQGEGEEKLRRAREAGLPPLEAADLLEEGRRLAGEGRTRAVKARAKLNFALDQLDEADRREYEALRAEARAEAHAQMAEDPLFNKTTSPAPTSTGSTRPSASAVPAGAAKPVTPAPQSGDSSRGEPPLQRGPRKTIGPRRRKGT